MREHLADGAADLVEASLREYERQQQLGKLAIEEDTDTSDQGNQAESN